MSDDLEDLHPSESMKLEAISEGWEATVIPDVTEYEISGDFKDIVYTLYAKRDKEFLKVQWRGWAQDNAHYSYGDYHLYPAWRGGVYKLIKGKPNRSKFSINDKGKKTEVSYQEMLKDRSVPWDDDEETPAFDILLAVLGKEIKWVTNVHGVVRERNEYCPKDVNLGNANFRLRTTSANKRVLNFGNNYGFHACYITDILEVS